MKDKKSKRLKEYYSVHLKMAQPIISSGWCSKRLIYKKLKE